MICYQTQEMHFILQYILDIEHNFYFGSSCVTNIFEEVVFNKTKLQVNIFFLVFGRWHFAVCNSM